jgi:hypothetical protein
LGVLFCCPECDEKCRTKDFFLLCEDFGSTLGVLWGYFGGALGITFGVLLGYFGSTLGVNIKSVQTEKAKFSHFNRTRGAKNQIFPTGEYFASTLGVLWEYFGSTLGVLWEYFGSTLGSKSNKVLWHPNNSLFV